MEELGTAVTSADALCKGDQGKGGKAPQFKGCFPWPPSPRITHFSAS